MDTATSDWNLFGILKKPRQTDVRQRVLEQLSDDFERDGRNMRADERRLYEVRRITHTRRQNFRRKIVVVIDGDNLLHQVHAISPSIINATNEGRNVRCTGLGS